MTEFNKWLLCEFRVKNQRKINEIKIDESRNNRNIIFAHKVTEKSDSLKNSCVCTV